MSKRAAEFTQTDVLRVAAGLIASRQAFALSNVVVALGARTAEEIALSVIGDRRAR